MAKPEIRPGDRVAARNAFGHDNERRAVTGVVAGEDFPVVWVCAEDEWLAAQEAAREPEGVPWPVEDVHLLASR